MPRRVLFRTEGGRVPEIGTGHIFRSLRLADALATDCDIVFVSCAGAKFRFGHAQVRQHGYPLFLLPQAGSLNTLQSVVKRCSPDFVICDQYHYAAEELRIFRDSGAPVMTFDLPGAYRRYADYPIDTVASPAGGRFAGPKYAVIPPPRRGRFRRTPGRIFVCFGGFDYSGLTMMVSRTLARLPISQRVDVIVSRCYPDLARLRRAIGAADTRVTVHVQPDDFAELLAASDIAVVSGGVTMFQALSVGTSVMVVSQYAHQRDIVRRFSRSGAFIDLGPAKRLTHGKIDRTLTALLSDHARRRTLRRNAMALVDGRGLERVSRLVRAALNA